MLETFVSEVELQGEPNKFPPHIEVNVSNLQAGNRIYIRDLPIPKDVVVEENEDLEIAKIDSIIYESDSDDNNTTTVE